MAKTGQKKGSTPRAKLVKRGSRADLEAQEVKKNKDRAERESKKLLAAEEGQQILAGIMSKQKEVRRMTKKKVKKMLTSSGPAVDGDDDAESGGEGEESELDSEEEALMRIRNERKKAEKGDADSDDEGSEEDDDKMTASEIREQLNNALLEKLDEIEVKMPFTEKMTVVAEEPLGVEDANDDLAREVEFYKQALGAVHTGRKLLDRAGIPHMRPTDYFAEMVKSDEHMARIKQNLLFEKKKMEAFEQRKKQQEYKKFSKEVQAEKIKEKASKKKKNKEIAQEFRNKSTEKLARGSGYKESNKPNPRREAKNKRYGFGGKSDRRNDRESVDAPFKKQKTSRGGRGGGRGGRR